MSTNYATEGVTLMLYNLQVIKEKLEVIISVEEKFKIIIEGTFKDDSVTDIKKVIE